MPLSSFISVEVTDAHRLMYSYSPLSWFCVDVSYWLYFTAINQFCCYLFGRFPLRGRVTSPHVYFETDCTVSGNTQGLRRLFFHWNEPVNQQQLSLSHSADSGWTRHAGWECPSVTELKLDDWGKFHLKPFLVSTCTSSWCQRLLLKWKEHKTIQGFCHVHQV